MGREEGSGGGNNGGNFPNSSFFWWFSVRGRRAPGALFWMNSAWYEWKWDLTVSCPLNTAWVSINTKALLISCFPMCSGRQQHHSKQSQIQMKRERGGISPSQPCLICRLLGNWNVPLLCCCLKVCEVQRRCLTCIQGCWGEGGQEREREGERTREKTRKEAEPNKKDKLNKLDMFVFHLERRAEVETHAHTRRPTHPETAALC